MADNDFNETLDEDVTFVHGDLTVTGAAAPAPTYTTTVNNGTATHATAEEGTTVTITGSGRGVGTGAYFIGTVEQKERFRYYAVVYGDINGDARVDGTDAAALEIAAMTSDGPLTQDDFGSAAKFEAADVNHDGNVDDLDIAKIVDHYTFETVINQKAHSTTVVAE